MLEYRGSIYVVDTHTWRRWSSDSSQNRSFVGAVKPRSNNGAMGPPGDVGYPLSGVGTPGVWYGPRLLKESSPGCFILLGSHT